MAIKIVLTNTKTSHGVSFTQSERNLCKQILSAALTLAEAPHKEEKIDAPVANTLRVVAESFGTSEVGLPNLCRATYRLFVRDLIGEDGAKATDEFPRLRDPASVNLLFRKAADELEASEENKELFPRYGQKVG